MFDKLKHLFGFRRQKPGTNPAEVYQGLRRQILELKPAHLFATSDRPVLAVLMETGYPEVVVTLVAPLDGSISLYFSNGGGIIGAGASPGPNTAARNLVSKAATFLPHFTKTTKFPLPESGHTQFFIATPTGVWTAMGVEKELGGGNLPLSPLFFTAHELITAIRLNEEKRGQPPGGHLSKPN